jgi:uncharacterized protein YdeI (YjbR/CyaY-like superfamily)
MSKLDELQRVEVTSSAEWRKWLSAHHTQKQGIWLVRYKKPDPRHVSWSDAVDEALCFGWIDSQPRKLDDTRSMLLITPRNPKSAWSGINKEKVEKLIAEGRMAPSGLRTVEAAKASGTWDKLVAVEKMEKPLRQRKKQNKTSMRSHLQPSAAFSIGFRKPSDRKPAPLGLKRLLLKQKTIFAPISGVSRQPSRRPASQPKIAFLRVRPQ